MHHQPLNGANEKGGGSLGVKRVIQLTLRFALLNQPMQTLPIVTDERLHHALGSRLAGALQFAEDHSWYPGVLCHEINMRHENCLQRSHR